MKKFYLYLNLSMFFYGLALAMDPYLPSADLILQEAKDQDKIIVLTNQDLCQVTLKKKIFEDDDAHLMSYLIERKVLNHQFADLVTWAIKMNSSKIFHLFLEHNLFETDSQPDQEKWLLVAIKKNNKDLVAILLDQVKCVIDKSNPKFLATAKNFEMVNFLINRNCLLSQLSEAKLLQRACKTNNIDLLLFFINQDSTGLKEQLDQMITSAIKCGNANILKLLFDHLYLKKYTRTDIYLFILISIEYQQLECLNFLVNNFEFSQTTIDEEIIDNPLKNNFKYFRNSFRGPEAISKLLSLSKANTESYRLATMRTQKMFKTKFNALGIIIAKRPEALDMVRHFLESGSDPNNLSEDGKSMLIHAIQQDCPEIVKMLIDYGADPELPDKDGIYPLAYASKIYSPLCISILLSSGANMRSTSTNAAPLFILANLTEKELFKKIDQKCKQFIDKSKNNINLGEKEAGPQNQTVDLAPSLVLLSIFEKIDEKSIAPLQDAIKSVQNLDTYFLYNRNYSQVSDMLTELIKSENANVYLCCRLIVEKDPKVIEQVDENKLTALVHAVNNNNLGASIALYRYSSKKEKAKALQLAKINGYHDIVSYFTKSPISDNKCTIS